MKKKECNDFSPIESINRPAMDQQITFDNSDLNMFMFRHNLVALEALPEFDESNPKKMEESINPGKISNRDLKIDCSHSFYSSHFTNIITKLAVPNDNTSRMQYGVVFLKVIFPHVLALVVSLLFIILQEKVAELCFCMPNCQCSNGNWIRIYTFFRGMFTKWFDLIVLVSFFAIFVINSKWAAVYEINWCVFGALGIYALLDGNACQAPVLEGSSVGISGLFVIYLFTLIKEKRNFKNFIKMHYPQMFFSLGLALNRVFIGDVLPKIFQTINQITIKEEYSELQYLCFIIVYSIAFKKVVFFLIFKIYLFMEELKYGDITPLIIMIRLFLCYMISLQTSNLMSKELTDFTFWIDFVYYAGFQYCLYTHSYPVTRVFFYFLSKITKKKSAPKAKNDSEIFFENLIAGYMIEFQMILIPRLLIMLYWKRWITSDFGMFYKNCDMEINQKFWVMDQSLILFLIAFNLILPLCLLLWTLHKKCNDLFDYKMEKKNVLFRALIIFGIHGFFEGTLQDYQLMKILGKGFALCSQ